MMKNNKIVILGLAALFAASSPCFAQMRINAMNALQEYRQSNNPDKLEAAIAILEKLEAGPKPMKDQAKSAMGAANFGSLDAVKAELAAARAKRAVAPAPAPAPVRRVEPAAAPVAAVAEPAFTEADLATLDRVRKQLDVAIQVARRRLAQADVNENQLRAAVDQVGRVIKAQRAAINDALYNRAIDNFMVAEGLVRDLEAAIKAKRAAPAVEVKPAAAAGEEKKEAAAGAAGAVTAQSWANLIAAQKAFTADRANRAQFKAAFEAVKEVPEAAIPAHAKEAFDAGAARFNI